MSHDIKHLEGFLKVPDTDDLYINKEGVLIQGKTNRIIKSRIGSKGQLELVYRYNKKVRKGFVKNLMAKTFLDTTDKNIIMLKDDNPFNIKLDNLLITKTAEYQKDLYQKKAWDNIIKFNLPVFTHIEEVIYPNAKESIIHGYYHIPVCGSTLVINKSGHVLDLATNKPWKQTLNRKQYLNIGFFNRLDRKSYQVRPHRYVGLLFVPKTERHKDIDFSDLEINHIDGNKLNNHYSNLEWCTTKENMQHAWDNDLVKTNTRVKALNIYTGEIKRFFSISKASIFFNVETCSLAIHLNSPFAGTLLVDGYRIQKEEDENWATKIISSNGRALLSRKMDLVAENVITGEIHIFPSLPYACKILNLNINIIKNQSAIHGKRTPVFNYIFYPLTDLTLKDKAECPLRDKKDKI